MTADLALPPDRHELDTARARHQRNRIADLEDPDRWIDAAADLLADLGFLLVGPHATAEADSHLLVALRGAPTLRHFDPEGVAYYARLGDGAALATLDATTRLRERSSGRRQALWGQIHVVDRIPVENRFLTFGGDIRIADHASGLRIADLWSPAPIVRWGGHSQGTDDLAQAIGAFFGRLIVPVDFVPGAAARIDGTLPEVLYRSFLLDALGRRRRAAREGVEPTAFDGWLAGAWLRARDDSGACAAAAKLLADLAL